MIQVVHNTESIMKHLIDFIVRHTMARIMETQLSDDDLNNISYEITFEPVPYQSDSPAYCTTTNNKNFILNFDLDKLLKLWKDHLRYIVIHEACHMIESYLNREHPDPTAGGHNKLWLELMFKLKDEFTPEEWIIHKNRHLTQLTRTKDLFNYEKYNHGGHLVQFSRLMGRSFEESDEPRDENYSFKDLLLAGVLALSPLIPASAFDLERVNNPRELQIAILEDLNGDEEYRDWYSYMYATAMVESKFDPTATTSDSGTYGIFQLRKCAIDDINRVYKTKYTYEDAKDIQKSVDMFVKYINILTDYYKHYNKGKTPTIKDLAMMYYGGPKATDKNNKNYKDALKYWNKIDAEMKKL